jgi:hypothetical protein
MPAPLDSPCDDDGFSLLFDDAGLAGRNIRIKEL